MCKKQLITQRTYAPALSVPTPTNANTTAMPPQHQSHSPRQPSTLLSPMTPHSQPHALTFEQPSNTHLLCQKKVYELYGVVIEAVSLLFNIMSILRSIIVY